MGEQMDLNFQLFETATLFITVIVVAFFLQVGLIILKLHTKTNLEFISEVDKSLCVCVCCYAGRDIELL